MKQKSKGSKLLYITLIFIVGVKFFLSYLQTLLDKSYKSPLGFIYPFKYDSYYYLKLFLNDGLSYWYITLTLSMVFIAICILLYVIINQATGKPYLAALGTLLFAFNPLVYSQTLIGYTDTPVLILGNFIFAIYLMLLVIKKPIEKTNSLLLLMMFIPIYFIQFWKMGPALIVFVIICAILTYIKKIWLRLSLYITFLILSIPIFIVKLSRILQFKFMGVNEYSYLVEPITLLIFFFTLSFIIKRRYMGSRRADFLIMLSLPLIVVSILISRLSTIALIPCIIYLCLASRDHKNKKKLLILAGSIIFVSLVYILIIFGSSYRPPVNTTYESLFYNLEDEPILSLWGEGHIINMFHSPGAIYKASPSKENLIIIVNGLLLKEEQGQYFFNNYFYILVRSEYRQRIDFVKDDYLIKAESYYSILGKLERGEDLIYFNVKSRKYGKDKYWLLSPVELS